MNILRAKTVSIPSETSYATSADFCRIFEEQMDRLYLVSLLLTADDELAEKCFVGGLKNSRNGNPVFKEWAQSWARRTIIANAIRMIAPRPETSFYGTRNEVQGLPVQLAAITNLQPFERFVFVMSVLEGYSERDCRLLLNCSSADIVQGRIRALQQLAASAERYGEAGNAMRLQSKTDDCEFRQAPRVVLPMAISA